MISGSIIVLLLPLLTALPAYVFRQRRSLEVLMGMLACGLVVGVLLLPYDRSNNLLIGTLDLGRPIEFLGVTLRMYAYDQIALSMIFLCAMILFALSWRTSQGRTFIPLGLCVLSIMSAGLMIRPFAYSGLLFVIAAALVAIMIQAEHIGERSTHGAMRYLILSTLALPAFLGAGYYFNQANASGLTEEAAAVLFDNASIFLGGGFVLLLGAFPLFTWTHLVANDAPPLTTAFVATVCSGTISFFYLALKQELSWFRNLDGNTYIVAVSLIMIVVGGVLAWAQMSFSRLIASALSVDIGANLLMLNQHVHQSVEAVALNVVSLTLSLGAVAIGLAVLRGKARDDDFDELMGAARTGTSARLAALAICAGGMSLSGLPGSIGFVTRWVQARTIASTDTELAVGLLVAFASVGIGFLRGVSALISEKPNATPQAQPTNPDDAPKPPINAVPALNAPAPSAFDAMPTEVTPMTELLPQEMPLAANEIGALKESQSVFEPQPQDNMAETLAERIAPLAISLPVIISLAIFYFGMSPVIFTTMAASLSRLFSFYR